MQLWSMIQTFPSPFLQHSRHCLSNNVGISQKPGIASQESFTSSQPVPDHTKTSYFPQPALSELCRAVTNARGIHVATTCPSITTRDSATAGDFPEVPAPVMGEQLLPSAPTQRSGKASPYLAILLTCLFPFHLSSFSKQSLLFVVHHPGQASVTFLRGRGGEVLGCSWTSAARSVLGLEGSEVLQHGPDVRMWAREPHLNSL